MQTRFRLYRQEKGFELLGVSISRTTMAGWIITCAQNHLKPVYDYFHRELLKRHFLMADETPIQVLK
ncbi:MAG: IS66 family transposase [Enterocloster sp.]